MGVYEIYLRIKPGFRFRRSHHTSPVSNNREINFLTIIAALINIMYVFFMIFTLFSICPGDEKIYMRLGTYGRNPHEPAILIHPRIS